MHEIWDNAIAKLTREVADRKVEYPRMHVIQRYDSCIIICLLDRQSDSISGERMDGAEADYLSLPPLLPRAAAYASR